MRQLKHADFILNFLALYTLFATAASSEGGMKVVTIFQLAEFAITQFFLCYYSTKIIQVTTKGAFFFSFF